MSKDKGKKDQDRVGERCKYSPAGPKAPSAIDIRLLLGGIRSTKDR